MTHENKRDLFVTRPSLPSIEEYVIEISSLWDTHVITNMGEKHRQLQAALEKFLGAKRCVLFANGHSALESTLAALDVEGEAITTPFTFASTTHAIVRAGLKPVMCDVCTSDGTIDPKRIEPLITDHTSVIVPVHVYGNVCDVKAIDEIANKHDLKVVYDAAHAFGVFVHGRSITSYGDASVLSFHATKVFNSIEGGAVCCNGDEDLAGCLDLIKNFGIVDEINVEAVGSNAKMSEFHAAMGLCNLRLFPDHVAQRAQADALYRRKLGSMEGVGFLTPPPKDGITANHGYFAITVDDAFEGGRDGLCKALAEQGIHARRYFYPCTNAYACYRGVLDPEATPVARRLSEQVLCLPMYAGITERDVNRVCDAIAAHLEAAGRRKS